MPIYEYQCPNCHTVFEEWLKSVDESDKPCPKCHTASPHIVSQTSFALKGEGWYVTEYGNRKEEASGAEHTEKPEATETTTQPEGTTANTSAQGESKTETKTESSAEKKTASQPAPTENVA